MDKTRDQLLMEFRDCDGKVEEDEIPDGDNQFGPRESVASLHVNLGIAERGTCLGKAPAVPQGKSAD